MTSILLINPNTSLQTLEMMLEAAAPWVPAGMTLQGAAADRGVPMIVTEADLAASVHEVIRIGVAAVRPPPGDSPRRADVPRDASGVAARVRAIVVSAFGDPGAAALRDLVHVPVTGIGEASILEAAAGGRRFGIATTTPSLIRSIERLVDTMGLGGQFTGVRVPDGDPLLLAADPPLQNLRLARSIERCFAADGAAAARVARERFGPGLIEPVPAAMRRVARLLAALAIAESPDGPAAVARGHRTPTRQD